MCPVSAVTGGSVLRERRLLALCPWGARPHGVSVSDRVPSGYSWPARWLRQAGGWRWHGEGRGERGETGRSRRAGLWQELSALSRRTRGRKSREVGRRPVRGQTRTERWEHVHAWLSVCPACLSHVLVCPLCKRGSQIVPKKGGLVPRTGRIGPMGVGIRPRNGTGRRIRHC